MTTPKCWYFLGGADLEMQEIATLLHQRGQTVHDAGLGWGARASAYAGEIEACLAAGGTPVLVELTDDLGVLARGAVSVDHHGPLAGVDRPCSLRQVFERLALPDSAWTRHFELVAANDIGGLDGLLAAGARADEARAIKQADYAAQRLNPAELRQAQAAVARARSTLDGRLTLADCPNARALVLADALHPLMGGPGFEALWVQCPAELMLLGPGPLVSLLATSIPGGWYGGALPARGYWGHGDVGHADHALALLRQALGHGPAEIR